MAIIAVIVVVVVTESTLTFPQRHTRALVAATNAAAAAVVVVVVVSATVTPACSHSRGRRDGRRRVARARAILSTLPCLVTADSSHVRTAHSRARAGGREGCRGRGCGGRAGSGNRSATGNVTASHGPAAATPVLVILRVEISKDVIVIVVVVAVTHGCTPGTTAQQRSDYACVQT
jgi:hypothetical protein